MGQYENALAHGDFSNEGGGATVKIDPQKAYDLPALIDIAERSNPDTRIAWEHARQAAKAVGLSESSYYPYLAASAASGYQHQLAVLDSAFLADAAEQNVALNMKWLLFDFGGREATVTAAKERLMLANVTFNATHQQIVFNVTRRYYEFIIAREQVGVAGTSLKTAQTVQEAAHARFDNGLATKPDVLQSEQQTAQADYDLEAARGNLSDARVALVESLGIIPSTQLQVADMAGKSFSAYSDDSMDELIDRALSQRPELVANLANLRATQAEVRKARADYYPKITLEGTVGWEKLNIYVPDTTAFQNSKPDYGVGISIDLPIFEGFARDNQLRIAQSELRAAESELADSRNAVIREVWKAYTDLRTALRKQNAAAKLQTAAESAFDASLEAYRHGLGTYVDVANAQRNVTAARSTVVDTRSTIFINIDALALSVGDLAKASPSDATRKKK